MIMKKTARKKVRKPNFKKQRKELVEKLEQMGYIAQPIQRLGRLHDQLWRAARIILDTSLHTRGMTVDEAVEFMEMRSNWSRPMPWPKDAATPKHPPSPSPT